jgi:hypothetical protein
VPSGTGIVLPSSDGHELYESCSNTDGPYAPFCSPSGNTTYYVGDQYLVSWDPGFYTQNGTVNLFLQYDNVAPNAGNIAWMSPAAGTDERIILVLIDKAWLKGGSNNNLTLYLKLAGGGIDDTRQGPSIMVTNQPKPTPTPVPEPKKNPLAVIIAVPIAAAFVVVMTCGVCIGYRKHRQIGLGNVMGRRRGYGVGKSRRERVGGKKGINLETMSVPHEESRVSNEWEIENVHGRGAGGLYQDEPSQNGGRNAFRDELHRQNGV